MENFFPLPSGHQSALARQRLMDDLSNLLRDTEQLLQATAGDVSETADAARQRLTAAIAQIKATAAEYQRRGVEAAQRADLVIRTHPYESMLTALIAGAAIGYCVSRHRASSN